MTALVPTEPGRPFRPVLRGPRHVEWHFCPRCETELDISMACPACFYDGLIDLPADSPGPLVPYVMQYAGTAYAWASTPPRRPLVKVSRTRALVAVAVLGVAALYGSILALADVQRHESGIVRPVAGRVIVP